ncbi:MAG: glycosyltransferase [Chitinophagales bacterium]|nr:glycosyltransferase [Chitinophagales bacterium]
MTVSKKNTPVTKNDSKLSLVIPCYNEEQRIPQLVSGLQEFVKRGIMSYEIIIVDDGSTDGTVQAIQSNDFLKHQLESGKCILIRQEKNQGKGAALKQGVAAATGTHVLTLDADMSCRPVEIEKWLSISHNKLPVDEIMIASREHEQSKITEVSSRRWTGRIFNFCVRLLTPLSHRDTQCGFKLYPADIAKELFAMQRSTGWAHDVELLYHARQKNIAVNDMPVKWDAQSGSKISPLKDSMPMFLSVLAVSIRLKWEYYITMPLALITKKNISAGDTEKQDAIFRMLFAVATVLLFFIMATLSFQFGITGDERVQKDYGEKVLDYFTTLGKDKAALEFKNLYFYGGFFDMLCAAANRYIGILDPYDMRHLLNAVFGFLMIFFAALIAQRLGNWRSGFIALVLLSVSPQLFGQSMNNPKDIPFAAAYAFSIYQFFKWITELPKPSIRTLIYASLGIAVAIGIRVGGLILVGILLVFLVTEWLFNKSVREKIMQQGAFLRLVKHVMLVSAAGYFGALLFWPYGLEAPFTNPFKALREMQNFSTTIRILFAGKHIMSNEVPWNYIPTWISITTPLIILFPAILMVAASFFTRKILRWEHIMLLTFAIVFPWAYAVYKKSSLYDGLRHFLFIVPLLTVLAALFFEVLFRAAKNKLLTGVTALALVAGVALPLSWSIKNHPNEYCYFNEFTGGINGAYGNYETDYWMNSIRETSEWFHQQNDLMGGQKKITVATNCIEPVKYYFRNDTARVNVIYVRYYSRASKDWDYGIFYSRFIDQSQLKNKSWPNTHTIYTAKADNVPLSIVVERKDKSDFYAVAAMDSKNFAAADSLYSLAVKYDPKNEEALAGLGTAQLQLNDPQKAIQSITQSLQIYPANFTALSLLGLAYAQAGKTEQAIQLLNQSLQSNPNNPQAYYYLGLIYQQKGDNATAQRYFDVVKQFQQAGQ